MFVKGGLFDAIQHLRFLHNRQRHVSSQEEQKRQQRLYFYKAKTLKLIIFDQVSGN